MSTLIKTRKISNVRQPHERQQVPDIEFQVETCVASEHWYDLQFQASQILTKTETRT